MNQNLNIYGILKDFYDEHAAPNGIKVTLNFGSPFPAVTLSKKTDKGTYQIHVAINSFMEESVEYLCVEFFQAKHALLSGITSYEEKENK
jgi:hypothetical protein